MPVRLLKCLCTVIPPCPPWESAYSLHTLARALAYTHLHCDTESVVCFCVSAQTLCRCISSILLLLNAFFGTQSLSVANSFQWQKQARGVRR